MPCSIIHDSRRHRVDLTEVELHHERARARVRAIECGRKRGVVRLQKMDRAREIDGVMVAVDSPDRTSRVSRCQAAEETERKESAARFSTHTTSVISEPSGRSSSVR